MDQGKKDEIIEKQRSLEKHVKRQHFGTTKTFLSLKIP